ncbi:MAG: peptidase [Salinivirgaceae bacterium]|nr:MAG: peptidase [Salinivirgaceae bacterium]
MDEIVFIIVVVIVSIYGVFRMRLGRPKWKTPKSSFPSEWRIILTKEVPFYNSLSNEEKKKFEFKIQEFLLNTRITGVDTNVDTIDKVLVAASAIIPIFSFDLWKYTNLKEVLIYPSSFNMKFASSGDTSRPILGMVGTGYMDGKMILSKQALRQGFKNETDKKNTAIHEFVHLIDKADGAIDGVPALLLERQYAIPWIDLINKKIDEIYNQKSDINPYGGTNRAEFFSVVSEYFFERPSLLKKKHPELYKAMEYIFKSEMSLRKVKMKKLSFGRNSPCPCGSGKKFKTCCGKAHYA